MFPYTTQFRRATTLLWVLVLLFNISEYVLEWVRAIYVTLYSPLQLPFIEFLQPFQSIGITLLISHLGLLFALITANALAFLTPNVTLRDKGLLMTTALGKRFIPFTAIRRVRSAELQPNGRYVVWIDSTKGLPLQGLLGSLLFGRWAWRGFLLTSDLAGFETIVAEIATQLKLTYGDQKFDAHFIEEQPSWLLSMLNAPRATVQHVVQAESLPINQQEAYRQMLSASLCLAIPAIVSGIIHLEIPWVALVIVVVALLEFPLVGLYLTAVPFTTERRMEFSDAMRIYPLTQLPRWWIAIGLTVLAIAGVPAAVLLVVPIIAIALASLPVVRLTEDWFLATSPESWLGILVTAIYQLVLYEMLIVFLPR